jgi:hypothetical protein
LSTAVIFMTATAGPHGQVADLHLSAAADRRACWFADADLAHVHEGQLVAAGDAWCGTNYAARIARAARHRTTNWTARRHRGRASTCGRAAPSYRRTGGSASPRPRLRRRSA